MQNILQPPQYFLEEAKVQEKPAGKFEQYQKQWFLTYSRCNLGIKAIHSFFDAKFKEDLDKYLIAEEKHKDGFPHIHAYLSVKKKIHIRKADFFDYQGFHPNNAGVVRNYAKVQQYCVKDQEGLPNFMTNIPLNEVFKPPRLLKVSEYLEFTPYQLGELNPATYNMVARALQSHKKLLGFDSRDLNRKNFKYDFKDWQNHIFSIADDVPDTRTIYWIYDSVGGLGKTTFALWLTSSRNTFYCKINRKEDILFRVGSNVKLFVFDIPRSGGEYINYDLIETLKDGAWEFGKYEGGTIRRDSPAHIFCFSNILPSVKSMSLDRWNIIELDAQGGFTDINVLELLDAQSKEKQKI